MSTKSNQYINALDLESDSDSESYEYQAPKHFKPVETKSSKTSHKISKPNKSLYLIKYPKSLPIGSLKALSATITQDSKSYGVIQSPQTKDLQKYKVFVNGKVVEKNIDKFLTINESVSLPTYDIDEVKIPRSDVPKVTGLKMRHFPSGYGAQDFFEEGTDNTDTTHHSPIESEHKHKKQKKEKKEKSEKKDKSKKKEKKEKQ